MLFPYFKDGAKVLKNSPPGLIKPRAKSSNSKVNRDFKLAKRWGFKVIYLTLFGHQVQVYNELFPYSSNFR